MRFMDKIIYLYLFICISLLLFNLFYILFSSRTKTREARRVGQWERELSAVADALRRDGQVPAQHLGRMRRRLSRIEQLTAYQNALFSETLSLTPAERAAYVQTCRPVFLELAWHYQRREPMERAFFAYVISVSFSSDCVSSSCSSSMKTTRDPMTEVLLSYLKNSTIYCRENVLQALYVLGDGRAVEQAFAYISREGWYHHPRLISDGMQRFSGDKEALVRDLWKRRDGLEECLVIGLVQFAAGVSGAFAAEFALALQDPRENPEVRLALMRYFHRHPAREVYPFLLGCLKAEGGAVEFSIVAAFVLGAYPGEETKDALKQALHSRNWYVRKNAASSLNRLGITAEDRADIAALGDSYASEILSYIEERETI